MTRGAMKYDLDDYVVWPNGTWATIDDLEHGGYAHMSDDYEIVALDDIERLAELGIETD